MSLTRVSRHLKPPTSSQRMVPSGHPAHYSRRTALEESPQSGHRGLFSRSDDVPQRSRIEAIYLCRVRHRFALLRPLFAPDISYELMHAIEMAAMTIEAGDRVRTEAGQAGQCRDPERRAHSRLCSIRRSRGLTLTPLSSRRSHTAR